MPAATDPSPTVPTPAWRPSSRPGAFWSPYLRLLRQVVLPFQWEALNDRVPGAEPSRAIANFRLAAGLEAGEFHGFIFQDSDVGKWVEAVAWSLETQPNPVLEAQVDEVIELLAAAQQPDGYLNTFYQVKEPGRRWTNLTEGHELYSAGHLLEGAVAWARVTGKRRFLDLMLRYVDLIDATLGPEPGKLRGYDGHPEVELALLHLYDLTGDPRHLALARYFVDERGQQPAFFVEEWERRDRISHWTHAVSGPPSLEYHVAHLPVRQQTTATGHAVRAVYLYAAMARLAHRVGDVELQRAVQALWNDITQRQMYVTGALGSTHHGEAFTLGYDLPNGTAYAETCAAIGLVFFGHALLVQRPRSAVADVIERVLYNAALASMSLDGRHYFYVNPLEVWPEASTRDPGRHHVKPTRQPWFGCACCPPNLARLVGSLGHYLSTNWQGAVYLHQYVEGTLSVDLGTTPALVTVSTDYPWKGRIELVLELAGQADGELALRIPTWCQSWSLTTPDGAHSGGAATDGYVHLWRRWASGDTLVLDLELTTQVLEAHPLVRDDAGKVCLQRGPVVYCFEQVDNGPGLSALRLDPRAAVVETTDPSLPEGSVVLEVAGTRLDAGPWAQRLYRPLDESPGASVTLRAVPYFLWGNRTPGEMQVWMSRV